MEEILRIQFEMNKVKKMKVTSGNWVGKPF